MGYGSTGVAGSWQIGITYFSAENGTPLALGTNDTPRLFIDTKGFVGIGTTNTFGSQLMIQANSPTAALISLSQT